MDPQARRNSLSVVRSFLNRLSHDDERDPVLALEAAAHARIVDDLLNSGHEQEILASLGRIETALRTSGMGVDEQFGLFDSMDRADRMDRLRSGETVEFRVEDVVSR
jgi:hypothetical protein